MDTSPRAKQSLVPGEIANLVAASPDKACVLLCAGKSCRKAKGFEELRESLEVLATVKKVKCVDVCDGPVVGVRLPGETVWFERMRSENVRTAVTALLANTAKVPKKLRNRRV